MNKLLISTAVALFTTAASAGDLPSKSKAPEAPAAVAAAPSVNSLTVQYGQDFGVGFDNKTNDAYTVAYTRKLSDGFSVGGVFGTTQADHKLLKQNLELQAGYSQSIYGATLTGKVGVGERFLDTGNFPYYALYGSLDYKVMDGLTFNTVSYRYRDAFDAAEYSYKSHQLATGLSYDINSAYSVSAKFSRNFDSSYKATGDSVTAGLTAKF